MKSQWCPSQVIEWIEIAWDAVNGTIRILDRRENSIAKLVEKILKILLRDRLVTVGAGVSLACG